MTKYIKQFDITFSILTLKNKKKIFFFFIKMTISLYLITMWCTFHTNDNYNNKKLMHAVNKITIFS